MTCNDCKKGEMYPARQHWSRSIKTLSGVVQESRRPYRCDLCGGMHTKDSDIAPSSFRYGWDVIKEVVRLHKTNLSFSNISYLLQSRYNVIVPRVTAQRMYERFSHVY